MRVRLSTIFAIVSPFLPLLKSQWVIPKAWSGLPIDFMASSEAGRYALVKAEAAAGGGQKARLYKSITSSHNWPHKVDCAN
jgi:hypothetical protein